MHWCARRCALAAPCVLLSLASELPPGCFLCCLVDDAQRYIVGFCELPAIIVLRSALDLVAAQLRYLHVDRAIRGVHVLDGPGQSVTVDCLLTNHHRAGLAEEDGGHRGHVAGFAQDPD